jgi:uncharacterized protein (TIGR02246 family)
MVRNVLFTLGSLSLAMLVGCSAPPAPAETAPPAPAVDAPDDIAAVNAVREKFMAAYSTGDAEGVASLYTSDAVSEPNNTPTLKGRDAILQSQKAMFEQVTLKVTLTPEETTTRGTVGLDRGMFKAEVTPKDGGPSTTNEGRYLVVLVKDTDGMWRVARDMDNAPGVMPAETMPAEAK